MAVALEALQSHGYGTERQYSHYLPRLLENNMYLYHVDLSRPQNNINRS